MLFHVGMFMVGLFERFSKFEEAFGFSFPDFPTLQPPGISLAENLPHNLHANTSWQSQGQRQLTKMGPCMRSSAPHRTCMGQVSCYVSSIG
jgi:hypothetical protein